MGKITIVLWGIWNFISRIVELFTSRYATVKKEPPARPPAPARRRKRSSKSLGTTFKDSPFPERQKRGVIGPSRPPRRGSSSSLIDQHKYVQLMFGSTNKEIHFKLANSFWL